MMMRNGENKQQKGRNISKKMITFAVSNKNSSANIFNKEM
jgi:hypothetical protein